MGHNLKVGNNVSIALNIDSKDEAERIFNQLLINSPENSGPLTPMPWGAMWGSCEDQFGTRWMVSSVL